MTKRLFLILAILAVLSLAGGTAFAFRTAIRDRVDAWSRPPLPPATPHSAVANVPAVPAPVSASGISPTPAGPIPKPPHKAVPLALPAEMNLSVPFTPQAPHGNWGLPYQEACEEASLIMAHGYFTGVQSFTPDDADRQILAIVDWEKKTFGYYEDTTAEETARMASEYFGQQAVEVLPLVSMDEVKAEVAKGYLVLLPAAGRLLGNPYFSGQGPVYHMLVVKGYTKDGKIITNDPGTRRGADYLYDPRTLFNAVHDWNAQDITQGAKVMIVIEK